MYLFTILCGKYVVIISGLMLSITILFNGLIITILFSRFIEV